MALSTFARRSGQRGFFGLSDVGFLNESPSLIKDRRKWMDKPSHHLHKPSSSFSSSLSSSASAATRPRTWSFSKIGLVGWYLGLLQSRPIITKSITSSIVFAASDITSQMITMPPSGSYDPLRTSRMTAYGLLILGLVQHSWFTFVSKVLPKRDVLTTLKKIVMVQALYAPTMTAVFLSFISGLRGESVGEIVARLKRDLLPTWRKGLFYWPFCDFALFKFVPVHLQPLASNACAYMWTIYLSHVASKRKVSID